MASTTSEALWMPPLGRHTVNIGSSLGRALKARKGGPAPAKNKLPEKDFYSFRYNFKPESVDTTKPGTMELKKGKEATSVIVERANTQAGEGGHVFGGQEHPAREVDCVLIYDEETETLTLEKLESSVNLVYDRRTAHPPRHPGSPLPAPSRIASSSVASNQAHLRSSTPSHSHPLSKKPKSQDDFDSELLGGYEDAEGEPDDELPDITPLPIPASSNARGKATSARPAAKIKKIERKDLSAEQIASLRKEEEEESEGEITEPPRPQRKLEPQHQATQPASKLKAKAMPRTSQSRALPESGSKPFSEATTVKTLTSRTERPISPPSSAVPKTKTSGAANGTKRPAADVDEETLEFGRASAAKRARPPPPSKQKVTPPTGLSLPLPSSETNPLPGAPSTSLSFPGSSVGAVSLPPIPPASAQDSDEEEWDEVQPPSTSVVSIPSPPSPRHIIVMEEIEPVSSHPVPEPDAEGEDEDEDMEGVEIDAGMLEAELEHHLASAAVTETSEPDDDYLAKALAERQPGPGMNAADSGDDEDFSSSDDSDDDD